MPGKIHIFDTTLRDGEQAPRIHLNPKEKLQIAEQLARLKVDVIEAGFPISSEGDFQSVAEIARKVKGPIIAGLARAVETDIRRAWEAVQHAERPRIHTFIATSDIHLKHQLRKERGEVLEMAKRAVSLAKSFTEDVEFSAMDATRSDVDFLCQVFEAAIECGATVINVPDTVGYATPNEFAELIDQIRKKVRGIDGVTLSVHCHNDLGLAVANSLAAVQHGAQQVEVAVNGLGERAGNAALEELVMIIDTRGIYLDVQTDINISEIARTSHLVSLLTGYPVQPNKAVVGRNAFAHESGIHQDGVLKERTTYEIMDPQKLGFVKSEIVLGKHSGRHAFGERLVQLGYKLSEEELDRAFSRFKSLADRKGEIKDEDLEAIVANEIKITTELFKLNYYQTLSGSMVKPTATVGLEINGRILQKAAYGDGPVDASFRAVDKITGIRARLKSYSIDAVTAGKDALGEVTVVVEVEDLTTVGRGVSTDIIEASILAYLNALNRAVEKKPELGELSQQE